VSVSDEHGIEGGQLVDRECDRLALVVVRLLSEPRVRQDSLAADLDQMAAVGDPVIATCVKAVSDAGVN
jgi:hypothetical protein